MSGHTEFPVEKMADVLGVSRSGFYRYRNACHSGAKAAREAEQAKFDAEVLEEYTVSSRRSGSPKIARSLAKRNVICGRKRVAASMCRQGIKSRYRKKYRPCTTDSKHARPIAQNLLNREFAVMVPNRVWVTDITYIATKQGWVYLAVFIDLYSRLVVGWSLDNNMETPLVIEAFQRALWSRKPPAGLLVHSDRGSQYASELFVETLTDKNCIQSMSRKGNCWDNAVAESFFGCLKAECASDSIFESLEAARSAIFEYIECFYNRVRMHSTIDYQSPTEFESAREIRIA